ncbi:MAG: hypothetical protein PHC88_07370 [Terrimicrobiaceae bacterium]|nr:hypothetical protein [Terrimicrobiaceae bacterium]
MRLIVSFILFCLLELGLIAGLLALGRRTDRLTAAPGLDLVVSALTWIPWVLAVWLCGWVGLLGCVLGQLAAMEAFCFWHEKRSGRGGSSILRTLNGLTSPVANNVALLATVPALPAFLLIRFSQLTTYPILVRTIRLPPYNHAEWVSVSRQKFSGLVGHDLVWCLYCDWMTGIYALGGEMLRNLESFWCPIRFYPGKKCENCKLDFPDIPQWVPADGTVEDVEVKLVEKYAGRKWNSWWGHPDRKPGGKSTPQAGA